MSLIIVWCAEHIAAQRGSQVGLRVEYLQLIRVTVHALGHILGVVGFVERGNIRLRRLDELGVHLIHAAILAGTPAGQRCCDEKTHHRYQTFCHEQIPNAARIHA